MANENMTLSTEGYKQLTFNEGVVMRYYNDDPKPGNCTWGIGTLEHYGPCTREELARTVVPEQVYAILKARVHEAEKIIRFYVKRKQLTQEQFDAAVSFAYNSRTRNIENAMRIADSGDMNGVAAEFMKNVYVFPRDIKGNIIGDRRRSRGLENRRFREAAPFIEKHK